MKPSLYIEGRSDHLVVQVMGPVVHPLVLMASIASSGASDETSSDQQSDNSSKEGIETVVDLIRRHNNGMSVDDCTSLISELFPYFQSHARGSKIPLDYRDGLFQLDLAQVLQAGPMGQIPMGNAGMRSAPLPPAPATSYSFLGHRYLARQ